MKYIKKPVVIDAWEFNGTHDSVRGIIPSKKYIFNEAEQVNGVMHKPFLVIETLEGKMVASVGDYIIKGIQGEFYPCKPDIFQQTYLAVGE